MSSTTGRARRKWTPDEDALLRDAVQCALDQSRPLLWRELAKSVPGRSNKDCRRRWWNSLAEGTAKGLWTEDEDDLLMKAVQKYGTNWRTVAQEVGTRTPDQCSSHWTQVLDPAINHCDWTSKEDDDLLHEVLTYATNWKTISTIHTPKRTTLSLKNRYSTLRLKFQKKANMDRSPAKRSSVASSTSSSRASSKRPSSPEYIPSSRSSSHHSHNHRSSIVEPTFPKLQLPSCDLVNNSSRPMSPISQFLVVGGSRGPSSYCSTPTYGCSTPTYSNASLPCYRTNSAASSSDGSEAMTPMSMHGSPLLSSAPGAFMPKSDITSAFSGLVSKAPPKMAAPMFGADYGMSSLFEQEDIPGGNELDFLSSFNTQVFTGMDTTWN